MWPRPAPAPTDLAPEPEPTMNPTENYLLNTLATLMNVDGAELCCTTPLEEQGVDSFVGLRFVKKIEKERGVALSLKAIFDYPNIRDIAAAIDTGAVGA
jgi:acyl carrier protein